MSVDTGDSRPTNYQGSVVERLGARRAPSDTRRMMASREETSRTPFIGAPTVQRDAVGLPCADVPAPAGLPARRIVIVDRVVDVPLRCEHGHFNSACFRMLVGRKRRELFAVYKNLDQAGPASPVPIRLQSACLTAHVFGCDRCDCGWQIDEAMRLIAQRDLGLVVYDPAQEGRGAGLFDKVRSYQAMDNGLTTFEAFRKIGRATDSRDFSPAARVARDLGVTSVELLGSNQAKVRALEAMGVHVVRTTELVVPKPDARLAAYLLSKRNSSSSTGSGDVNCGKLRRSADPSH